ncbi:hypothetical protein K457DRAFT_142263 [Linnemannia elongata AG-77]|uniref:Uncharacterized protein n=1 Tax=Linnemannia elongata AG-77 TaxID=1314771 RepID=A0A197JHM6_9FUNG|nr:hypothetical protein K457DRAFT_142263 [Linnemannia elongata AG-77]
MSHRRASTTSSISSFFDPSREIDSFASPVRGGMLFSEPPSSSSTRPPTSSSSASARPPTATAAKQAPTSSLTSSLKNASNNNNASSQPVAMASAATAATAAVPIPAPPSSGHSRNSSFSAGGAVPLSVSISRQRSFSSSFSLATSGVPISAGAPSPRTFTGSSMISNPGSFPGSANPFALGAFSPLSPTSSSPPGNGGSNSVSASVSQSVPVLHRRFSSSFNQLNQIVSPPAQSIERGRRTSMFGGSSPPTNVSIQTAGNPATNNNTDTHNSVSTMGSGLFRKFSTSRSMAPTSNTASTPSGGAAAGHPFDRNDAGPTVVISPQPSNNQQQHSSMLSPSGTQDDARHLTTAVDKLKPSYDKTARSSSPMRSMILNGQMLD